MVVELLQFKRVKISFQVDGYGFPTLEGLVGLYSDGVNERGYFMAVLEASRECLMKNHDLFSRTVPMGKFGQGNKLK